MKTKKRVNSKQKGKAGERFAAAYLRSIGFKDARRTAQNKGTTDSSDVECPQSLPRVYLEIKYGYPRTVFDLGGVRWVAACDLAAKTCGSKAWAILWRPKGCSEWRLTFPARGTQMTISGDVAIKGQLLWLNEDEL